jgi:hypothetical protein
MKLNLNARELLAIHNLLRDNVSLAITPENVQLQHVYNRIQTCIVNALSNKATDPVDAWFAAEQKKIDKIIAENNQSERDTDPDSLVDSLKDANFFVPEPEDIVSDVAYPRKSHSSRSGHRKHKK